MSDTSYPTSSEELSDDRGEVLCGPCQNVVPGAARNALCGPPLPRNRFERACMRVYANGPLSLRIVLNVHPGERSVHEVVPYPRDILHWVWDFLNIFRAQEAQDFVALRGRRRVERLLRLGGGGYRMPVVPLPRLWERMPPIGRGHGRSPGC
ncbi:hypothetical protein CAJAP_01952 [Camponotus japonicus]